MNKEQKTEERKAQVKELKNTLDQVLDKTLIDQDKINDLINHYKISGIYSYSLRNTTLIKSQGGKICQSYKNWQKVGRQVKKGEKSNISILIPIFPKVKKEEDKQSEEIKVFRPCIFTIGKTFDIEQTEGDELKYNHNSAAMNFNYSGIKEKLQKLTRKTIREDITGEARGYCSSNEIVISSMSNDTDKTKTLVHEMAHAMFNHIGSRKCKDTKEVEAEAVAALVMSYLEIDYSLSSEYIASYNSEQTKKTIQKSKILTTAEKIIKAISDEKKEALAA